MKTGRYSQDDALSSIAIQGPHDLIMGEAVFYNLSIFSARLVSWNFKWLCRFNCKCPLSPPLGGPAGSLFLYNCTDR